MFKDLADSLLTLIALAVFIFLAVYLFKQDASLVGPI